ncbi:TonB-dependent receptor [Flagellimonas myxillae]|uniref:TonB-dependent receptor n=1 Tax=Flagellimonas myxillae TaxID=2942214 RepID=UPI00201EE96C|nr:TonB-dependent receptor [Muricauda myxillae]MCL6268134.1 TonB-dependent receptor family protein [Muricauda myxillae]
MGKNITPILLALLMLLGVSATAQKITLVGTVRDTLQNPLEMANVVAVNQSNQALDGFGITNSDGLFRLHVKANTEYLVKISYLGFKPKEIPVSTMEQDLQLDVTLHPQAENLEEVEVVYEIPVTVKGDTIVYNTDSFVSGTEKKLADVLEKLPGIEVNDDGEIEVEGKTVSKVMVEGEDFFDGDSKLASKNIPANALDKVEVLRNYTEVSQLSGVTNNQDNVALNIKLKEGKKKFWFGEITGGLGLDERYVAHPKLFYYSPNFSINILTDLNNLGEIAFSRRDYWNFTGGFRGATRNNTGTTFTTGSSGLGLAQVQNNRAKDINSKFGALNFSYKPSEAWRFSGFGIYSYTNTLLETMATRTFISSEETENTETQTDQTSQLGLIKLASNYKPSDLLQWDYDVLIRLSDEEELENTRSVSDVTDDITQNQSQKPTTVTQNSNVYYTASEDHIFALEAQYEYADENPFYNAIREQQPFLGIVPFDQGQSNFNINQNQYTQTHRLDAKLDHFWVTGPKSNLNFTLGTIQSSQRFNSSIFQILDSGGPANFNDASLNNTVEFNFSDLFLGFHYKVAVGKLTLNPGFHVHSYTATNTQLGTAVKDDMVNVVPDLFINYQFKQSESIRLNYNIRRNFSDINSFAEGYIFNNYNSLYQGNTGLESALYHNVNLNFFSFSMFNMQNIFANASYSKRIDAFKTNTAIAGINQVSTTINSNLDDETLSGSGGYQRTFGRVKLSARASLSYSNTYNIINDAPLKSTSFTQNYTTSVGSSFTNAPNLELGYRFTKNDYDNANTSTTFLTDRPFVKFDAAFGKGFILLADYDYYFYRDKAGSVENKYGFLNASLSYQKKDSKWEYSLEATNLTNNRELNQDTYNDQFFRTSSYLVQPRYVVLKVKYDL